VLPVVTRRVIDASAMRTPQPHPARGVISPCLSNVFLHHVLDEWFEIEVKPRLRGECTLACAGGPGQASRTVWTYPPPRQDAPRRLPPKEVTGCVPSGNGWDQLRLPGPDPRLGTVPERQEHGSASDGQGPICPRG